MSTIRTNSDAGSLAGATPGYSADRGGNPCNAGAENLGGSRRDDKRAE